jgi:hypothetical protein
MQLEPPKVDTSFMASRAIGMDSTTLTVFLIFFMGNYVEV